MKPIAESNISILTGYRKPDFGSNLATTCHPVLSAAHVLIHHMHPDFSNMTQVITDYRTVDLQFPGLRHKVTNFNLETVSNKICATDVYASD
jgi:hypothetical protein